MPADSPSRVVELESPCGLRLRCMDVGATWLGCRVPVDGESKEVLLGSATTADYLESGTYLGATIGRYANRIAEGRFVLNGRHVRLDSNDNGNTLHGGPDGFNRRRWRIAAHTSREVRFELDSPDGDQGFPGNLHIATTYALTGDLTVEIRFEARTDAPTPINLTNHAYFNLVDADHGCDVRSHHLQIDAESYLPVDETLIPRAGLRPVDSTAFDLRRMHEIHHPRMPNGYDHAFLLNEPGIDNARPVATLAAPDDRLRLLVFTDKPALQVYTGEGLGGVPTRNGARYRAYAGIALETQFLPDTPNHPEWPQPDCIFDQGDRYRYTTRYRFIVP